VAASFFENQAQARRSTGVLVVLFVAAVIAIVVAVNLVAAIAYGTLTELRPSPALYTWSTGLTLAAILFETARQVIALSDGGETVALMCGGERLEQGARDPAERRLLNIVEEMAIASGVAVPPVFVLRDEQGINAFAAGYAPNQAVVAVTRGALEQLNRDELQAVIGHEFSHILNGDMRLNVRMIGVLAGILFIGTIGQFLLRIAGRSGSSSRDDGKLRVALFAGGLALLVIGYVGLFFGRLIKASVSRQREYLADASSVQFTRNPDGIAGALATIGGLKDGSRIQHRNAETFSHMFFAESVNLWFSSLFATHPAIEDRIERVRPGFVATMYRSKRRAQPDELAPAASGNEWGSGSAAGFAAAGVVAPAGRRPGEVDHTWGRSPEQSARMVGKVEPSHVDFAAALLKRLPEELTAQLRESRGAAGAIVALLLAGNDSVEAEQLVALRAAGHEALADAAREVAPLVRKLGPAFSLPLIELALPAVKAAGADEGSRLVAGLSSVIHADRRVSLREFIVRTLVKARLEATGKASPVKFRALAEVRDDALQLLALVAHSGRKPGAEPERDAEVDQAFRAGAEVLSMAGALPPAKTSLTLDGVAAALEKLKLLAPMPKGLLIQACFAAITADGTIRLVEAELMRTIGAVLDCPLPPLLETIDPFTLAA
jgi:Zn-dependent protease with chaperone function